MVVDDSEVKHTKVEFFFDDDTDRSGVVTARGVRLSGVDVSKDFCTFIIRLEKKSDEEEVLRRISPPAGWREPRCKTTLAVSHPHGVAKRFTCGTPGDVTFGYTGSDDFIRSLCIKFVSRGVLEE